MFKRKEIIFPGGNKVYKPKNLKFCMSYNCKYLHFGRCKVKKCKLKKGSDR